MTQAYRYVKISGITHMSGILKMMLKMHEAGYLTRFSQAHIYSLRHTIQEAKIYGLNHARLNLIGLEMDAIEESITANEHLAHAFEHYRKLVRLIHS
jgi:hypothetical protein